MIHGRGHLLQHTVVADPRAFLSMISIWGTTSVAGSARIGVEKTKPNKPEKHLYPGFTKRSKLKKRISASKTVKNGQKSSFLAIFAG